MLKIEDIYIFIEVADSGGFSIASKVMNIDVANISRAIQRLEKQLNCSLFHRTTRKVELTIEGEIFLGDIRDSLNTLSLAQEKVRNLKSTPSGRLRVNAAAPFILHALTPLICPFQNEYPNINIELTSDDTIIDLLENRVDIAIRIGALDDSTLKSKLLGRSPLYLVASPDYLKKNGFPKTPKELKKHKFIGFLDSPHLNILQFSGAPDINPTIWASSGETIRQLCLQSNGIAYLSNFMIHQDITEGRLIPIIPAKTTQPNNRELVQAVYYSSSVMPARTRSFLDFIAKHIIL